MPDQEVSGRARRAVSELVVIVFGVLIALSADQWWASRAEADLETAYLASLVEDIAAARNQLEDPLARTTLFLNSATSLSAMSGSANAAPRDTVARLVGDALFNIVSWDYRLPTLHDLKNTGRLGLISDPEIRRGLAEIDRLGSRIDGVQDDLNQTQHQTVDPFLIRSADLPAIIPTASPRAGALLGPSLGVDHSTLLPDPEFQNIIGLRIVILLNLESAFRAMDAHLEYLANLIREAETEG